MVFVGLALLVALAVVLGAAPVLGSDRPRRAAVPVLGAGLVVALVVGMAVLGGLRGASHDEPGASRARTAPTTVPAPAPASRPDYAPAAIPPGPEIPLIHVAAAEDGRLSPYPVVDGLQAEGVVRVVATRFDSMESGFAEQCVVVPGTDEVCGRRAPVRFDDEGRADFQVLVDDTVDPGRCRAGRPTCLLRVTGSTSGRQGTVQTVFVDRAARAEVTLDPAAEKRRGYEVTMALAGLNPGTEAVAVVCGPQETFVARGCAAAGSPLVVGVDGSGRATVVVGSAGVGADRVRCGPRRDCGVWVFVGDGHLAASAVPIVFPAGASASYDSGRLAVGLGLAFALAAAAVLTAMTTDWTKPTEASAPALEQADLQTAASLDGLFGTEAELDQRDPIP